MMSLFFKECRQISRSIIYLVFIGVVVLFYFSQLGNSVGADIREAQSSAEYNSINPLMKPPPDAKSYGSKAAEIPEQVMPGAIASLVFEHLQNGYTAYPIAFYKNVKLNAKEQAQVADIITEITGTTPEVIMDINAEEKAIPLVVSYETFRTKMAEVDDLIGGGSKYALDGLKEFGNAPITYEEKLADYQNFIEEDRITGAYARLFSDYMGITLALFSIFVPVSFLMRDRRARMNELIYSRRFGSSRLILCRYWAMILMLLLPIVLLSLIPLVQLIGYGMRNNVSVNLWAFLTYIAAWLLPTVMVTTAVGFLLTTLTDTPIAIAVQFLWGFLDISANKNLLGGDYGAELSIRHNTLDNLQAMKDGFTALTLNRSLYALFSLLLIMATILIYELKRRGKLDIYGRVQKIFTNRKSAAKADTLH
ncbi:ABC transporter permease [Paenibacillus donghaensis]|uniref:Uncharacterized protein n=1 Tax=Paenibacillus donghaensis TaxID=414771 RepID=A0A2Z2KT31_9BACL|nr:ABC transporter permease [Paenibacillus donghaensis]ASA23841.1 hypothetical protein B9T62_25505 [Paenibacillus donghaensis]